MNRPTPAPRTHSPWRARSVRASIADVDASRGDAPTVLVASRDRLIHDVVRVALEDTGYEVCSAYSRAEAVVSALETRPVLIILAVLDASGRYTVDLEDVPSLASIPTIYLTPREMSRRELEGYDEERDLQLLAPISPHKIGNAIAKLLGEELDEDGESVRGALGLIGLASLLSMLELERVGGRLEVTVTTPRGTRIGEIDIRAGVPIQARVISQSWLSSLAALGEMLTWEGGDFMFRTCELDGVDEINRPVVSALMEAARITDEARRDVPVHLGDQRRTSRHRDEVAPGRVSAA